MKKIVIGIVALTAFLAINIGIVHAATQPVKIVGTVMYKGNPVSGIEVLVECWDTGFSVRIQTDHNGKYSVDTRTDHCPLSSMVKVRAEDNTRVGHKLGTVALRTQLDINLVTKISVPEYDWINSMIAASGAAVVIIIIRRQLLKQSRVI